MNGKHQQKAHTHKNHFTLFAGTNLCREFAKSGLGCVEKVFVTGRSIHHPLEKASEEKKTRICWLRWTHTAALNEVAKSLEHLSADACVSIILMSDVCQATAAGDHRGRFYHSACMRDSGQNKWSMAWNRVRKLQPEIKMRMRAISRPARSATEMLHRRVRCCK